MRDRAVTLPSRFSLLPLAIAAVVQEPDNVNGIFVRVALLPARLLPKAGYA